MGGEGEWRVGVTGGRYYRLSKLAMGPLFVFKPPRIIDCKSFGVCDVHAIIMWCTPFKQWAFTHWHLTLPVFAAIRTELNAAPYLLRRTLLHTSATNASLLKAAGLAYNPFNQCLVSHDMRHTWLTHWAETFSLFALCVWVHCYSLTTCTAVSTRRSLCKSKRDRHRDSEKTL